VLIIFIYINHGCQLAMSDYH